METIEIRVSKKGLMTKYNSTRKTLTKWIKLLNTEETRAQTCEEVSPAWWNLGHTSWFYARNILKEYGQYTNDDTKYDYLLNSYYESLGPKLPRSKRGLITNPTTKEIIEYRSSVDARMNNLLEKINEDNSKQIAYLTTVGINHEQQHQELFLTEIKHIRSRNPSTFRLPLTSKTYKAKTNSGERFLEFDGGLLEFGNIEGGWCYDNELPIHKYFLLPFGVSNRTVTNKEFLEFIDDGGYSNPMLWLSDGWDTVMKQNWNSPLYWEQEGKTWHIWTLQGMKKLNPDEPVCHISFYEADAYAKWKGMRLPTERELEHAIRACKTSASDMNFMESGLFHPIAASGDQDNPLHFMGNVWEWTSNHYEAYPGYQPFQGPLAEYNSKFMDNQRVLRGGSCASAESHLRASYRNFWPPETRFQFSGIRLAKEL